LYCVYVFSINSLSILYNVVHAPRGNQLILCVCVDVMYSGEYNVFEVTLSVYPQKKKMASKNGVAYPYMGTTRHFHVVFDVRVLDLNLSNVSTEWSTSNLELTAIYNKG
jgi:hypothetical protein